MLGTLAVLALAVAPAPQGDPPAGTIRVGSTPAAAGEGARVTSVVEMRDAGAVTVGGAKLRDLERSLRDERSFEARVVLSAEGAPQVRVEYGECRSVLTDPGGANTEVLDVSSEHYWVALDAHDRGAGLIVQSIEPPEAPGRRTSAAVATLVGRDVGELLLGSRFAPLLADQDLPGGTPINVPPEIARTLLEGILDEGTVDRFTLTPRALDAERDAVAFTAALAVTMQQESELSITTTFELAGEILLGRTHGRLVAIDLAGPIRYDGATEKGGARVEVRGTGTLSWTYRAEPLAGR